MDDRKPWERGWDTYLDSINFSDDDEYVEFGASGFADLWLCGKNFFRVEKENLDNV